MKRHTMAFCLSLLLVITLTRCQLATNQQPAAPAASAATATQASTPAPADDPAPAATVTPANDEAPASSTDPAADTHPATASLAGLDIDAFFEQSYARIGLRSPQAITELGLADALGMGNDQLDDMSDAYASETYAITVAIRDRLLTYDRDALSAEQALSYDIYLWFLEDQIEGFTYAYNDYLIRPGILGYQDSLIHFFTQIHPVTDKQDAEDYVTRLTQVETQMLQVVDGLNRREEAGVMLPRFINQWITRQVQAVANTSPTNTAFYTAFAQKLNAVSASGNLSADDKQSLLAEAQTAIQERVQPGFAALADCLKAQQDHTDDRIGASKFPNGAEYYDYILRHYTTTDLTADEIHALGEQDLERIHSEMRALFDALGYPQNASLPDLFARVTTDGGSVFGSDIVAEYEAIITAADAAVAEAFDMRPQVGVIVIGGDSGGYYVSPAVDGSRPGAFYARATGAQVRFTMPSLAYHEAIPGHHYQLALAQELNLPFFRKNMHFTGYVEGWALYAEYLAKDLGWYDDDIYGDLGRLQYEAWRAVRLVVDTGIHAKGWTYEQTIDYMVENTGMTRGMMEQQLWRYITWPGQATAYKVGMLKIMELRERAQNTLGDAFDFKAFHNVLIGNGTVPLEVLEHLVDEYIAENQP